MQRSLYFFLAILFVLCIHFPANGEEEGGRAYFDFGVFAYEDGAYGDAEENFQQALEFDPENPFYNHYLGKTYLKMERYQPAMSHLAKAWEINPEISGLKYDMAYLNYKMSYYRKAAELFSEIIKEEPENVLALYHGGITLFRLERYEEAIDYLVVAADISPNIMDNSYYYAGICYLKGGALKKAVEKFEYVRDHSESESLKEYAIRWLQATEKRKKAQRPYNIYLKVGYEYDDNVMLEPVDDNIYSDEDDTLLVGYFSGGYDIINRRNFKMGAEYSHYQTMHDDLDEYDLTGSIGNVYARYSMAPVTFGLSYLPHYYWVDSDSFLMRHQLRSDVTWKVDSDLFTRLSYSYYRNNHFQDDNRDGHTNEVFLDAYYILGVNKGYLFAGIGYEDNSASHADEYYEQLKTKVGISLKLFWGLDLSLTGRYYEQDYDNRDSFYGVKREDKKYKGSASLSRRIFYDWLSIVGDFSYTKNDSNIDDYEYERNVATLSLTALF